MSNPNEPAKLYLLHSPEPVLTRAGSDLVLLGPAHIPTPVDVRVVAEQYYQKLLERIRELEQKEGE